jgi:hypothetical protein
MLLRGRDRLFHDEVVAGGAGKRSLVSIMGAEMFICDDVDRLRNCMIT